jgi:hypothetical protein
MDKPRADLVEGDEMPAVSRALTGLTVAFAWGLALVGCGAALDWSGDSTQPIAAEVHSNVVYVEVAANGGPTRSAAVDTGAPVTLLDPNAFAGVSAGHGQVAVLQLGAVTLHHLAVEGLSPCGMMACSGDVLDGLVGGNVLSSFRPSFDYQGGRFSLSPLAPDAETVLPFSLEGGGLGRLAGETEVIRFEPTRIAVVAMIEGGAHPLVVDSGASLTVIRPALFQALAADGRGRQVVSPLTVMGIAPGEALRLRSISLGGAEVNGAPALQVGDALLDALSAEVGHNVDGLVGGTFLREFMVMVDYGSRRIRLHRYPTPDPLADEFRRVGLTLAADASGQFYVQGVFPSSDASRRLGACFENARVLAISGQSPDGLSIDAADRLLRGMVGDPRELRAVSACDGSTLTITLTVEDLLPLP